MANIKDNLNTRFKDSGQHLSSKQGAPDTHSFGVLLEFFSTDLFLFPYIFLIPLVTEYR